MVTIEIVLLPLLFFFFGFPSDPNVIDVVAVIDSESLLSDFTLTLVFSTLESL